MINKQLVRQIFCQILLKDVSLVWGEAESVSLENRYWVIGNSDEPRWIIPFKSEGALSVLRQWRPYSKSAYLKWQLLLTAYQLGKLHNLPGIISIGVINAASSCWKHLGYTNQPSILPTIYIGTPGPTRKAVVSLIDPHQQTIVGVVKVALEKSATQNVLREAETLTYLASEKPGLAPTVLFVNQPQKLAVQTIVPGKPVGKSMTPAHIEWLSRLLTPEKKTSLQEQVCHLNQRTSKLTGIDQISMTKMDILWKILNDPTPLPSTWIHGDFAPWNLKWVDRQTLVAVDWEDAKPDGLPLYDIFHHQYIQSNLLNHRKDIVKQIWHHSTTRKYLRSLDISQAQYQKLALYYLADMWIRSIERSKKSEAKFFMRELSYLLDGMI